MAIVSLSRSHLLSLLRSERDGSVVVNHSARAPRTVNRDWCSLSCKLLACRRRLYLRVWILLEFDSLGVTLIILKLRFIALISYLDIYVDTESLILVYLQQKMF